MSLNLKAAATFRRKSEAMKVDDVCENYARKKVKLTVRLLDDEDVLIEGTPEALEFLGKLLLAHVADKGDGFHLSPRAAGSIFFSPESTKGIYFHQLPCVSSPGKELASADSNVE